MYNGETDSFIQNTGFSRAVREASGQYRFYHPEVLPFAIPMVSLYAAANGAVLIRVVVTALATETECTVNVFNSSGGIVDSIINLYLVDAVSSP